jgi:hypothetical protein
MKNSMKRRVQLIIIKHIFGRILDYPYPASANETQQPENTNARINTFIALHSYLLIVTPFGKSHIANQKI